MRIDSGFIGMDSARHYQSSVSIRRSIESSASAYTTTDSQLASSLLGQYLNNQDAKESDQTNESLQTTEAATDNPAATKEESLTHALNRMGSGHRAKLYNISERDDTKTTFQKFHEVMIHNIIELIFGNRQKNKTDITSTQELTAAEPRPLQVEQLTTNVFTETYYEEYECTSFNAFGKVKCDDGREIDLNLNISMSRRFTQTYSEYVSNISYRLTDPLVINMSDAPASLSDMKFFFDLDADGNEEEISSLASGSGFLALDKNGDGIINDGRELFGTQSGDGFKDLAMYDEDGNGWIDENDAIFEKLKIFTKDAEGNDILYTLKDKNVGAIFLGNADTDFSLNSQTTNQANGYIRKTGVFLYEDGTAGTLQHIDLVS